jgi:hypothetical protein
VNHKPSSTQKEKKLTKEERELVGKLRVFARFHSQEEHDALIEGLLKAQRLRNQIELYKAYRKMGLRTLDEIRRFENDRKNFFKNRKNKEASSVSNNYSTGTDALSETEVETKSRKRGRPAKSESVPVDREEEGASKFHIITIRSHISLQHFVADHILLSSQVFTFTIHGTGQ